MSKIYKKINQIIEVNIKQIFLKEKYIEKLQKNKSYTQHNFIHDLF